MGKEVIKAGDQFGKLRVLSIFDRLHIECLCACGRVTNASKYQLLSLKSRTKKVSCGCARSLSPGVAASNVLFNRRRREASKRGLAWGLSKDDFLRMSKENCFYCGSEPVSKHRERNFNGAYTYNGIDRKENQIGYSLDNCVTCCAECNFAKGVLSSSQWISLCRRVAHHQREGER